MKKEKHPEYRKVLFVDTSTNYKFLCGSTLETTETEEFEGVTYPVYHAPITSFSHPFYTDDGGFVDTEGRIDKWKKRYEKKRPVQRVEEGLL